MCGPDFRPVIYWEFVGIFWTKVCILSVSNYVVTVGWLGRSWPHIFVCFCRTAVRGFVPCWWKRRWSWTSRWRGLDELWTIQSRTGRPAKWQDRYAHTTTHAHIDRRDLADSKVVRQRVWGQVYWGLEMRSLKSSAYIYLKGAQSRGVYF